MDKLTFAQVSKLLKYDPETGKLFWLPRAPETFATLRAYSVWTTRFSGKEALIAFSRGYKSGTILGKQYVAHRVAWILSFGYWPKEDIDHINGVLDDNRLLNLREASSSENNKNLPISKRNTSGAIGVSWSKKERKWEAHISVNSKKKRLGIFYNFDDALSARKSAERNHGYHKNHGRRNPRLSG